VIPIVCGSGLMAIDLCCRGASVLRKDKVLESTHTKRISIDETRQHGKFRFVTQKDSCNNIGTKRT
jgi:hypothetical protein